MNADAYSGFGDWNNLMMGGAGGVSPLPPRSSHNGFKDLDALSYVLRDTSLVGGGLGIVKNRLALSASL
jgi:hypothetical protein